jgi:hypothetical protein
MIVYNYLKIRAYYMAKEKSVDAKINSMRHLLTDSEADEDSNERQC